MGETYRAQFQGFTVHGSYSKGACSAQANLRSHSGKTVAFSIYWRPGRSLHLLTTHPDAARLAGRGQAVFAFPDGTGLAFPMRRQGAQLSTSIGFGSTAQTFYRKIQAHPRLQIQFPALGDAVDVALTDKARVESALFFCKRAFLHK